MQRRHFLISAGLGAAGASITHSRPVLAEDVRWQHDGAGTVARFGILTPDFDPVPESERWAMVPRGISIHAARVARSRGSGAGFVEPPHVDDAVDRLVELAPRAILLGYTSSSYALGAEADDRVRARLEQRAKGIPIIFTCSAATAALRDLNVGRISLVHPPWWSEQANNEGAVYWRAAGFDVLQCTRMQPTSMKEREVPLPRFSSSSALTRRMRRRQFLLGGTACAPWARSGHWRSGS